MLATPVAHLAAIELREINACLTAWGHAMGPLCRPRYGRGPWCHGLYHHGELVAVAAADRLVRETCAGLRRSEAVELARLCAVRPGLCRVMLRLWRELILPDLCQVHGWTWAVSYQDAAMHSGDLYRFDGWLRIGDSRSGTDQRSGRKGRNKVVWGWQARPGR